MIHTNKSRRSDLGMAAFILMIVTMGWLLTGTPALAEVVKLKADLAGKNEVPPTDSKGIGTATITLDRTTRTLTWMVTFSGLTSRPTMAHFHGPATTYQIGGIQITIGMGQEITSPLHGSKVITEEQANELLSGHWYVNVHTATHAAGEIRGQVVPAE
jgi:CHRD domain-containing protein